MRKKITAIIALIILCSAAAILATGYQKDDTNDHFKKHQPQYETRNHPSRNFTNLTGLLNYQENKFTINGTTLFFGPDEIIESKTTAFDYDGDEIIETEFNEITGLLGTTVCLKGHINDEDQYMVFDINGLPIGRPSQPLHHHGPRGPTMNGN